MMRKQWGNHPPTESGAIGLMGDLFEDYAAGPAWDEMFDPTGWPSPGLRRAPRRPGRPRRRRPGRPGHPPGPLPAGPGHHLLAVRRGAALPPRPGAPGHRRRGVGRPRGGRGPAGAGPRGLPGRRLRAAGDPGRRASSPAGSSPVSPHFHRAAAGLEPPNGVRVHVAGIDLVRGADGRFGCWRTTCAPRRASPT